MKMCTTVFVFAVICVFTTAIVYYAEAGEKCAADCVGKCSHHGSGKDYAACVENCLKGCFDKPTGIPPVPEPKPVTPSKPKSDLKNFNSNFCANAEKESASSTIVVASASDDKDQPCYVGGKYVGNCSRNKPYYNAFNGECYATLKDCGGSSSCVRCGK
jgi:hypothetical protein